MGIFDRFKKNNGENDIVKETTKSVGQSWGKHGDNFVDLKNNLDLKVEALKRCEKDKVEINLFESEKDYAKLKLKNKGIEYKNLENEEKAEIDKICKERAEQAKIKNEETIESLKTEIQEICEKMKPQIEDEKNLPAQTYKTQLVQTCEKHLSGESVLSQIDLDVVSLQVNALGIRNSNPEIAEIGIVKVTKEQIDEESAKNARSERLAQLRANREKSVNNNVQVQQTEKRDVRAEIEQRRAREQEEKLKNMTPEEKSVKDARAAILAQIRAKRDSKPNKDNNQNENDNDNASQPA